MCISIAQMVSWGCVNVMQVSQGLNSNHEQVASLEAETWGLKEQETMIEMSTDMMLKVGNVQL